MIFGVRAHGGIMRGFAILVIAAAIYCGPHVDVLAQTSTPNVVSPPVGLSTPLTSTTTNCMMSCNAQVANCQTGCFIPEPPGYAHRNCDLEQPDGKHGVRDGL